MKKTLITIMLAAILFVGVGCQGNWSHKDTFVIATKVAVNHLNYEKNLELTQCEESGILPENCDNAEEYEQWISTLSTFEDYLNSSEDITVGAEEIDLMVNVILAEMGDKIDPSTKLYVQDIKTILYMLVQDSETRTLSGRPPIK